MSLLFHILHSGISLIACISNGYVDNHNGYYFINTFLSMYNCSLLLTHQFSNFFLLPLFFLLLPHKNCSLLLFDPIYACDKCLVDEGEFTSFVLVNTLPLKQPHLLLTTVFNFEYMLILCSYVIPLFDDVVR